MVYCSSCGAENLDVNKFCHNCGNALVKHSMVEADSLEVWDDVNQLYRDNCEIIKNEIVSAVQEGVREGLTEGVKTGFLEGLSECMNIGLLNL